MSNQPMLQDIIQKAIDGGWDAFGYDDAKELAKDTLGADDMSVFDIIFNHDFAKALWGDELLTFQYDDDFNAHQHMGGTLDYSYNEGGSMTYIVKAHLYHVQQMVIADDPIKYAWENSR